MNRAQHVGAMYFCPMHRTVREPRAGQCPECGMDLLPEGTKFALLRHIVGNPVMLATMAVVMAAIMAAIMMMVHR